MEIRSYKSADLEEIGMLFYQTVHEINIKDYSKDQVNAWAPKDMDLGPWDQTLRDHYSLVALEDGKIVGFGDIDRYGYLDRLYVHKDYQGRGIGSVLCDLLEVQVSGRLTTQASITARPFFEKRGYRVLKDQEVRRNGLILKNFLMEKIR